MYFLQLCFFIINECWYYKRFSLFTSILLHFQTPFLTYQRLHVLRQPTLLYDPDLQTPSDTDYSPVVIRIVSDLAVPVLVQGEDTSH